MSSKFAIMAYFFFKLYIIYLSYFHSLEVVGRNNDTQLQEGEN